MSDNVIAFPQRPAISPEMAMHMAAMDAAWDDVQDAIDDAESRCGEGCSLEDYYLTLMFLLRSKLERAHFKLIIAEKKANV